MAGIDLTRCVETPPGVSFLKDAVYFRSHESELMRDYPGKFVAIRGEEVIGAADTRRELLEQVIERLNAHLYFYCEKVCPESFLPPDGPVYLVY